VCKRIAQIGKRRSRLSGFQEGHCEGILNFDITRLFGGSEFQFANALAGLLKPEECEAEVVVDAGRGVSQLDRALEMGNRLLHFARAQLGYGLVGVIFAGGIPLNEQLEGFFGNGEFAALKGSYSLLLQLVQRLAKQICCQQSTSQN